MKSFSDLIDASKNFNLGFNLEISPVEGNDSLKLSNHFHPWSLREQEAKIVYDTIIHNNLKRGFEIATAFGVSSATMAQAFKITGGKLVTMDAYVEENFNHCFSYDINTKFVKKAEEADGYNMAKKLYTFLDVEDFVSLEIGWSPDDIPVIMEKNFGTDKLDFIFIDGGHTHEQIDTDVKSIYPYADENCIIAFHDYNCAAQSTTDFLNNNGFTSFKDYKTGFILTMFSKGNKILI